MNVKLVDQKKILPECKKRSKERECKTDLHLHIFHNTSYLKSSSQYVGEFFLKSYLNVIGRWDKDINVTGTT